MGCLEPLFHLAVMLPSIAVGVRRMHDTDHSGWWYFLPLANVVLACRAGTEGTNRYGPDAKGPGDGTVDLDVFS